MPNWQSIFMELMGQQKIFTIYLRYVQKDTLAKIPNVRVAEAHEDYVKLENEQGYGILAYDEILYISMGRQ